MRREICRGQTSYTKDNTSSKTPGTAASSSGRDDQHRTRSRGCSDSAIYRADGLPAVFTCPARLQHAMRGYADVNALTMSEMAQNAENVANEIKISALQTGDRFGIGINVTRTVRSYERAGVAAIHIEDFTVPKLQRGSALNCRWSRRRSSSTRSRLRSTRAWTRTWSSSPAPNCSATMSTRLRVCKVRWSWAPTVSGQAASHLPR